MIKNIIAFLLLLVILPLLLSCQSNDKKYDYTIDDIIKEDSMWNIEELSNRNVKIENVVERDGIRGILIDSDYHLNNGVEVMSKTFAFVGIPDSAMPKGGYPAILLIHGGGGHAFIEWVKYWNELGYVAMSIDIAGQMYNENFQLVKNNQFLAGGTYGSISMPTTYPECKQSWTYQVIASCISSNNFLRSMINVDREKIGVTGISWGGFVTCILSGIDKRFAGFAPIYGCGSMDTDSWGLTTVGLKNLSDEKRSAWAERYDPNSYLEYSTKPILFVSGANDNAFSSYSRYKSSKIVPARKFFSYRRAMDHGHYWELTYCVYEFMQHIMYGEKLDVNILEFKLSDDKKQVTIEVEDLNTVDPLARLVYSTSTVNNTHEWTFVNMDITLTGNRSIITLPAGVTSCFVEIFGRDSEISFSTDMMYIMDESNLY